MMTEFFSRKLDYGLAPLYYWQARQVAKSVQRLPEPEGVRTKNFGGGKHTLSLGIFGDSAAAGVGVAHQDDAPFGQIGTLLGEQLADTCIQVKLHATSGHTSFDLLHRLYAMPADRLDVAVISIGVNDVICQTPNQVWMDNLQAIIGLLKRKFGVSCVMFLSLPPMQLAPSLPRPLNGLIGRRALALSDLLACVCDGNDGVYYIQDEFAIAKLEPKAMFAKDGFHPNATTYQIWAKTLSKHIGHITAQQNSQSHHSKSLKIDSD